MNAGHRLPGFTIVGAPGFVGSHLLRYLRGGGYECYAPDKGEAGIFERPLGHVIYCAGLTADFRQRPHDTMRAHVAYLNEILERAQFTSLLYLSSTRVYIRAHSTMEDAPLLVAPGEPEDIFNLSKLAGESICLHCGRGNVRVARLSNVLGEDFGSENFAFALIKEAQATGRIVLHTTFDSEKDYIRVDDVVELLRRIALDGGAGIYNVAAGTNITNQQMVESICEAIPASVVVAENSRRIRFAEISTERVRKEFAFVPRPVLPLVAELAARYRDCST